MLDMTKLDRSMVPCFFFSSFVSPWTPCPRRIFPTLPPAYPSVCLSSVYPLAKPPHIAHALPLPTFTHPPCSEIHAAKTMLTDIHLESDVSRLTNILVYLPAHRDRHLFPTCSFPDFLFSRFFFLTMGGCMVCPREGSALNKPPCFQAIYLVFHLGSPVRWYILCNGQCVHARWDYLSIHWWWQRNSSRT
jgi:hypothetical protein